MPEFLPFIGTRYNPATVDLSNVVAPPYDVINPEQREALYAKDPHNVVRVILNHDADPYTSAKKFFIKWHEEEALIKESAPAFYVYYQVFTTPEGKEVTRAGVIGKLKLEPYENRHILPHERTHAGPKRDRLQLMEATHANLSPIFGLIDDPSLVFDHTLEIASVNPAIADIDEEFNNGNSVRHIFWKLTDPTAVDRITKIVEQQRIVIADGHHRYETALKFSEMHPEIAAAKYMMVFITNIRGEGAVILPTHRVLYGVEGFDAYKLLEKLRSKFDILVFPTREEGVAMLERENRAITLMDFGDKDQFALVLRKEDDHASSPVQKLPVYVLQEEILKGLVGLSQEAIDEKRNIWYPHTLEELDEMVDGKEINASFILKPITPSEMIDVTESGEFMPQKSTYFYPKLLSGLVFHEFEHQQ